MAEKIEFTVTGMTCDHCVHSVTTAVKDVPGVKDAIVSLEGNSAVVEGDNLDAAKIIAAIQEEGYEAAVR